MPPPKKPKNGPTTIDQFIDRDELQESSSTSRAVRFHCQSQGVGQDTKESSNWKDDARSSYQTTSPLTSSESKHAFQGKQSLSETQYSSDLAKNSPSLASAKNSSDSTPSCDSEGQNSSSYSSSATGSILERLFTSTSSKDNGVDNLLGETLQWQPKTQTSALGYNISTSNKLATFFTKSDWKHGTAMAEEKPGHHLQQTSSLNIQGQQTAAFLSSVHQHQQQHSVGRSILASLFSVKNCLDASHPSDEEIPQMSTALTDYPRSSPNTYLSNLMRQPPGTYTSSAGSTPTKSESANSTESSIVYLHPAFQLPPSATSTTSDIRKNFTSSPCLPPSSQAVTEQNNAKPSALHMKSTQGHSQSSFHGSNLNSSSNVLVDSSLLDLSVKNISVTNASHKNALKNSFMVSALIDGSAAHSYAESSKSPLGFRHSALDQVDPVRTTLCSPVVKKEIVCTAEYHSESDQEGSMQWCHTDYYLLFLINASYSSVEGHSPPPFIPPVNKYVTGQTHAYSELALLFVFHKH
ncbi:nuclear hormone receptor HR38 [Biomphalaria glabrata]|nr:nuclear hormone receptor HR38 [Biomphalaria glabrata]